MEKIDNYKGITVYKAFVVVVGSGAAGLNAVVQLNNEKVEDVVLLTEGMNLGTSRNTGSDKQTYYKLTLSGEQPDSVYQMAEDLFKGKAVDGDIALCEASLSAKCFLNLAILGLPFPQNRYGEYIGYKTDHDPHYRATSAGPYTSKFMSEVLEKEVRKTNTTIIDGYQVVKLLVKDKGIKGLIALERTSNELIIILTNNVVIATGGPASIYEMSVYPESQFGSTGLAFEVGCKGKNLTEWQFGLASLHPRWNVSGSYMQVLPRFVSVDEKGIEYDFLFDYFVDFYKALSLEFLKGYQWPFDIKKLEEGSSIIDILCYLELEKGRHLYLDFVNNPNKQSMLDFTKLSPEASTYLQKAKALGLTPIERLRQLNEPSYQFYLNNGIDLEKQKLEIALCAQHNNGGLAIDCWWQSNIKGLFPVGEVAASHGVYRPGGSALNAGQVGSTRAALYIKQKGERADGQLSDFDLAIYEVLKLKNYAPVGSKDLLKEFKELQHLMSLKASVIRESEKTDNLIEYVNSRLANFEENKVANSNQTWLLFQYRNALLTSLYYLFAIKDYSSKVGYSRGSALYTKKTASIHPRGLDERFCYDLETENLEVKVQEIENLVVSYRSVRPLPKEDNFFETVWFGYRTNKNVY